MIRNTIKQPVHSNDRAEQKSPFKLTPIAEVMNRTLDIDWTIKGYLPAHSTIMIFGKPASGKSLIAMEMAYCIGTGEDYCGQPVTQGAVVYIAGEGQLGIKKRFTALGLGRGEKPRNIHVSELPMDLCSAESVKQVSEAIMHIENTRLIIIDTLHRNFTGDENSSKDFATVMQNCDILRKVSGASVLLVHHSGHNTGRARGSSSMNAAMDVEYEVSKNNNSVVLKNTKAKDIETPTDVLFRLKPVEIGSSAEGEPITAPLLIQDSTPKMSVILTPESLMMLEKLKELLSFGMPIHNEFHDSSGNPITIKPGQLMVPKKDWLSACSDEIKIKEGSANPGEAKRKRFDNSLRRLHEAGEIARDRSKNFTIPIPIENGD